MNERKNDPILDDLYFSDGTQPEAELRLIGHLEGRLGERKNWQFVLPQELPASSVGRSHTRVYALGEEVFAVKYNADEHRLELLPYFLPTWAQIAVGLVGTVRGQ